MINVSNLSMKLGGFELANVSFGIRSGAYAILMGKTGTGKTSLLEALCGLRPILGGRIELDGRDVTALRPGERGIGYVPQDTALFNQMTVREHLAFALEVRERPADEIKARVDELAKLLGIEPLLDRKPYGLSGGERQRVALGRALAARPSILCLDEPLSALDEETHGEMVALLRSAQKHEGVTVLHVTHSLREAQALGDLHLYLKDGAVLQNEQ